VLRRAGIEVVLTEDIRAAANPVRTCFYTDVWVSMGKESESAERIQQMSGYQINSSLASLAKPDSLVMHCLPAYRGKEIDEVTFEKNAQTIFDQAENRLHVQKSILVWLNAQR
jgi:ornithine carbamoyltransferase